MSYILEALKKSQRERELGQVPRLQAPVFDEPREQTRMQRWIIATFALAALAAVLAVYASFRSPAANAPGAGMARSDERSSAQSATGPPAAPEAEHSVASVKRDHTESESGNGEAPVTAVVSAIDHPKPAGLPMAAAGADAGMGADADEVADAGTDTAEAERDVERDPEPQVLVVPAPPKPGERLPRGAEELRRAVLGDDASPADAPALSAQREPTRAKAPISEPAPEHAPIPPELIAEIEAFKRSFREEGGGGPATGTQSASTRTQLPALTPAPTSKPASRSASKPAEQSREAAAPLSDQPAPLSSKLRRELPPFSMTVHVYDADPARRFVYLNGSKLREGERARDGFFVEEVRADGAVLRYDEYRFFQSP